MKTRLPICPHCRYDVVPVLFFGQKSYSCEAFGGCRKIGPWRERASKRNPAAPASRYKKQWCLSNMALVA